VKNLSRHFDELMEEERTRIAFNLHDDLGQKLAAINMNIAWVKGRMGVQSQGVSKKLDEISQLINDSIESIREITSYLRPVLLFDLGVVPAFDSLLKKFENQSGIICTFIYDHEDFQIDNRTSLTLYRILQESLTDIIRHSDATEVEIKLSLLKNRIGLHIEDNGKVPDENDMISSKKLVIAGLRERAGSLNGRIRVKEVKESGTSIKVSIPLKSRSKDD
jgi:signal transduction histidine kinase